MIKIIRTATGIRIEATGPEAVAAANTVRINWRKAGSRRNHDLALRYANQLASSGSEIEVRRDWMI